MGRAERHLIDALFQVVEDVAALLVGGADAAPEEDHAGARAAQRLVRRRRDDVGVVEGAGHDAAGHQAADVRHVGVQVRLHLVAYLFVKVARRATARSSYGPFQRLRPVADSFLIGYGPPGRPPRTRERNLSIDADCSKQRQRMARRLESKTAKEKADAGGHLAEGGVVEEARVGRRSGDDDLGPEEARRGAQHGVVDEARAGVQPVRHRLEVHRRGRHAFRVAHEAVRQTGSTTQSRESNQVPTTVGRKKKGVPKAVHPRTIWALVKLDNPKFPRVNQIKESFRNYSLELR